MSIFLQVFLAFFSAIMQSFAIQNEFLLFGSPFLGLFSLVPLYFAFLHCKSYKIAGLLLSIQFTFVHLFSSFWLGFFKDFAALTLGGTVAYYTVLGFFLGQIMFVPFNTTRKNALQEKSSFIFNKPHAIWNIPARVILFASLWTIYEWFKSIGFLGYPWVTILMTSWKWPLLTQIVSITGTWGITFLFTLFNAVVAEGIYNGFHILHHERNKSIHTYTWTAAFCVTLFICALIQGFIQYNKERIPTKTVDTVMVQTNTDSWLTFNDKEAITIGQNLTTKAIEEYGKKPDLVIWSEALLADYFPNAEFLYNIYPLQKPLLSFVDEIDAPFIIGGPTIITQQKTGREVANNSALYFDKDGNYVDFYGKIHLVPFAERIPYDDSEFVQKFMQRVVGFSSGWAPGEYYTLFDVPLKTGENIKISTPICFEDAFSSICRSLWLEGSEAFYNITNDSWSMTNSAEIQHFVISSFRSQELRTTLVRSTNSGFSVVVDPAGKIIYSLPLFEAVSGGFDVPIYERETTLYALLGDWLPISLLVGFLIFYLIFIVLKINILPFATFESDIRQNEANCLIKQETVPCTEQAKAEWINE